MDGQRMAVVARSKRGGLKLLLLLPMLVLFAGCDLAITKSASPDPATVGEPLTYTLGVTNNPTDSPPSTGDQGRTNVTVTDTLPESVEFVSATPSQGACAPPGADPVDPSDAVVCQLGTLEVNQSATIEIVVIPNAAGQIENTASVDGTPRIPNPGQEPELQPPFCDDQGQGVQGCDPLDNNTVTITTLVNEPGATPPDDGGEEPTPPDDQYGEDPTPPGQTPVTPGDDVTDGTDGVADGLSGGNLCQNIVSGISDVGGSNNASQIAGDDTAIGGDQSGNANNQSISQDDAQAIAQQNNTTIDVVQQCAQDGGVNVIGGGSGAVAPAGGIAPTGSTSVDSVEDVDANGDGVVGEAEARAILGESAPQAIAEADTDSNGTVSVGEAKAYASDASDTVGQADTSPSSGEGDESTSPAFSEESTPASTASTEGRAGAVEVLPDTGGTPLGVLALTGALLLAGGLIARRIVG